MGASHILVKRHIPLRVTRSAGCVLLSVLCLPGCTEDATSGGFPPPGTMTIIAVEPVEVQARDIGVNKNPGFAKWWAGAPAPEGYNVPDAALSSIERVVSLEGGSPVAKQTWKAADTEKGLKQLFHVELGELEANKTYVFVIEAIYGGPAPATLELWELGPEKRENIEAPLIQLIPSVGVVKRYVKTFTPTFGGHFALAARCAGASSVEWIRWEVLPEWAAS